MNRYRDQDRNLLHRLDSGDKDLFGIKVILVLA